MQAWTEARATVVAVHALLDHPPLAKRFALQNQLSRAALSAMNNIAEGFARGSDPQFCHFLDIARGSAAEVESMLYVIEDLAPELAPDLIEIRGRIDLMITLISKLTKYLRGSKVREAEESYDSNPTSRLPDFRTSGL
ncbi:MAG: four helix bundle protein [Planctomycetes bacterium]|nr:four helix bundle protein [Planctomycetota bacterium]